MKKAILFALCSILFVSALSAQTESKHNIFCRSSANRVTLAAGFWTGNKDFTPRMPQMQIGYQRLIADFGRWGSLGAGVHVSYIESRYNRFNDDNWMLKDGVVGVRATYNYTIIPRLLEAYAGAMAGYRVNKFANPNLAPNQDKDLLSPRQSGVAYSFSAGARYWFIDRLALVVGVGDGVYMNVGLATKF